MLLYVVESWIEVCIVKCIYSTGAVLVKHNNNNNIQKLRIYRIKGNRHKRRHAYNDIQIVQHISFPSYSNSECAEKKPEKFLT